MKRYPSFGLLALLFVVALTLASCAGAGSGEQGSSDPGDEEPPDGKQGMTHESMDHGDMKMGSGDMMDASEMLMENGEYSDERFIDLMAPHHQGAVKMAQVALENAEHPELRQLAQNVITDQQFEIERLRLIKEREFGPSDVPMEMSSDEMEKMGMKEDPQDLASQNPFDKAFINEMIPHHVAAIEIANVAIANTSNDEIREIAQGIAEAQEAEIEQMNTWLKEWYPEGKA